MLRIESYLGVGRDHVVAVDDDLFKTAVFPDDHSLADDRLFNIRARHNHAVAGQHGRLDSGSKDAASFRRKGALNVAGESFHRADVRRRVGVGDGPNRPLRVIECHLGVMVEQIHVRLPVCLDGPNVAPVGFVLSPEGARLSGKDVRRKVVGKNSGFRDEFWNDIPPEIMACGEMSVLNEGLFKDFPLEDIVAHGDV